MKPVICTSCGHLNPPGEPHCDRCASPLAGATHPYEPAQSAGVSGYTADPEVAAPPTLDPGQTESLVGTVVGGGRYEVLSKIGEGGMGTVFRAEARRLRRSVALKVLHSELLAHPTAQERMLREAQALARVQHPNVVKIHDQLEVAGCIALVLDYLPDGELLGRLADGPLAWERAVDVMEQVLDGLEAIHRAGLVHRDLKTANILMDGDTPCIADLGIAHDVAGRGITRSGVNPGTPEYMSPEQVRGQKVDARSDLYACGVVLFELLSGELPFVADSEYAIKKAQVEAPPDLHRLPEDVPEGVRQVCARALAKSPNDRYQTALAMRSALASPHEVADAPEPEAPEETPEETPEPLPEESVQPASAPVAPDPAPASNTPMTTWAMVLTGIGLLAVAGALAFNEQGLRKVTWTSASEEAREAAGLDWASHHGERFGRETSASLTTRRNTMVREGLEQQGTLDRDVIAAMAAVPMELFVPDEFMKVTYENRPVPIGYEETISQPTLTAYMLTMLGLKPGDKVLEVKTASGYQTALMAKLGATVYTIETHRELGEKLRRLFEQISTGVIHLKVADRASAGWPEHAPYEAIIVTAALEELPRALADQLAVGG
ncbi:MAG: protein kinase, partial [Myxococcota bacterium]|nr:protein kinase [Myxococcota bacterium]